MDPVFADPQGRFFFANLPAGAYTFDAAMPGYQAAVLGGPRAIIVADGERQTGARIRLVKLSTIAGTVRDEAGDPATGTEMVALRRAVVNGRSELQRSGQTRTDDRGNYRLSNLRPGEYLVCACARDPIPFDGVLLTTIASEPAQLLTLAARAIKQGSDVASLDGTLRTFPPTLYPNSTTIAQAERLTLTSGEDRTGIDISMSAVRAARVSGALANPSGPTLAGWMRLTPANEGDDSAVVGAMQPMLVQPDGRFDFAGVPPGQYLLKVTQLTVAEGTFGPSGTALALVGNRGAPPAPVRMAPEAPLLWAAEPITVGGDDVRGVSVVLRQGLRLSGRIEFQGATPPPPPEVLAKSSFGFLSLGWTPAVDAPTTTARVSADATFVVPGVLPGLYYLSPRLAMPGWSVKSITLAGVDVTDVAFDVARDLTDFVLTLGDAPVTTLTGTFTSGPTGTTDDYTALIFPVDRRYWTNPGAATRRYRQVAISQTGAFSVSALAPGEYFVVAVTDDVAFEWQDARKLDTFARSAQRVLLSESGKASVTLKK